MVDLLRYVWNRRWWILIATLFFTAVTAVVSLSLTKQFTASTTISAVADDGKSWGGPASIISQLGGLASIAGLSVSGSDRKSELLAILQSESLTEKFIEDNQLLQVLFASDWDAKKHDWKTSDSNKTPTLWKASVYFRSRIRGVSTDTKTGLTTLTITWCDPQMAAKWANELVALANRSIRDRAISESERNVEYLTKQLKNTEVVAVQNSIGALLEVEFKRIMLARGNTEYAFKVIDPALPPERPSFPNPVLWTIVSCVLSFVGASGATMLVAIYRSDVKGENQRRAAQE